MNLGKVMVGIGLTLIVIASAFIDGAFYAQAVVVCVIGTLLMVIPVFVTYILPVLEYEVRRLIAKHSPNRGMRVYTTKEED